MKTKLKAIWSILTKDHLLLSTWNNTDCVPPTSKNIKTDLFISKQTDWLIPQVTAKAMSVYMQEECEAGEFDMEVEIVK